MAITLSVALGFIDTTAVGVALPSIQRDFDTSTIAAHWVVLAFLLTSASLVAAAGRAGDVLGRRRVYLVGLGLFALASLLCGAATDEWWLVAGRAVQGIGSAAMSPAAIALLTTNSPEGDRGRALGSVAAMASVGLAVGPLLGGFITVHLSWRWIFFINEPLAILIALLVLRAAVESRDEHVHGIDYRGLALLTLGLTSLIVGISRGPDAGFGSPITLTLVSLGGVLLTMFLLAEARAREPLIRLEILRHRHVAAANTVGFFSQFAVFSLIIFGMSFVQKAFGLSAFLAGLVFLPRILPQLLFARRVGRIADSVGPTVPVGVGMGVIAVTLAVVSVLADHGYVVMIFAFLSVGLGVALIDTPRRLAAQSAVASEYQGVVAGISSTVTRLGATLGITLLGTLLVASQYGRSLHLLAQSGIRLDQDDRFALDSLLANGLSGKSELRELPPQLAGPVQHAAHNAYTYAFTQSMRVAAAAVLVAGVVAIVLLRARAEPVAPPASG